GTLQANGMLTAQAGAIIQGGAGWGLHNAGKQLLITGGGTNPTIAISDNAGTLLYAISNNFGQLIFAKMPPLSDSTTAPNYMLSLTATLNTTSVPFQLGTVGFNNTAPIA